MTTLCALYVSRLSFDLVVVNLYHYLVLVRCEITHFIEISTLVILGKSVCVT